MSEKSKLIKFNEYSVSFLYILMSLSIFVLIWHFFSYYYIDNSFILPTPSEVIEGLVKVYNGYLGSTLYGHIFSSLKIVLVGYFCALLIGVPLGISMAWYNPMNILFSPLISVLRPIPPPAWIPLAILWFGIDMSGKVFVIIVSAIVPCILNSYLAISEQPKDMIAAAKTMGANNKSLLFEVMIPAGLPTILTGMRIALGSAWATVVAAELVVSTSGLGYLILAGYRNFEAYVMAAGIIVISIVGLMMNIIFKYFERKIIPWSYLND